VNKVRIGIAQINPTVGDFTGNKRKIIEAISEAKDLQVDLLTFPELVICGYPPEDLLFKPQFIAENLRSLKEIVNISSGLTIVIGFIDAKEDIYNAAAIIHNGQLSGVYHKVLLPNYGVFDENRYFRAGKENPIYIIGDTKIGVGICEDVWYEGGPATSQALAGAEVIIVISASPYHFGKGGFRERMISTRASDNVAIFVYSNLVGGQDELVFDGNSLVIDEKGQVVARGKLFEEDLIVADLDVESVFRTRLHDPRWRKEIQQRRKLEETRIIVLASGLPLASKKILIPRREMSGFNNLYREVYDALVLGIHDYVLKNGFAKVLIGLSGGIDSSLVAAIAVDALGKVNVIGVSMPSRYTSSSSIADAKSLADNLGITMLFIPLEKVFTAYLDILAETFEGTKTGVAEENLQARIRGNILLALSNKFGWLVLTTGNKSEMATGYTTIYGDMAGGFAVIKDVPKTMVYELVKYRNLRDDTEIIPATIVHKAPSAELRPEQKDIDTLPPYDLLDRILTAYVEEDKSVEQIIEMGIESDIVKKVAKLVDMSEYKRRQAPPGIKITPRAFGRDRRLPLTNKFKEW
jgi:NAD+ synthase (glutamine-hydrolysing)